MRIRTFSIAATVILGWLFTTGVSHAQPPGGFIDLGTIVDTTAVYNTPDATFATTTFTANQVQWFKFSITSDATNVSGFFLDINTTPRGTTNFDTEIGVYRPDGTLVISDDDSGPGLYSLLSFGLNSPSRGPIPSFNGSSSGTAASGQSGGLPAGEYYLAAAYFNTAFGSTGFNVTTTGTTTADFNLEFRTNIAAVPEPATLAFIGAGVMAGGLGIKHWRSKRKTRTQRKR